MSCVIDTGRTSQRTSRSRVLCDVRTEPVYWIGSVSNVVSVETGNATARSFCSVALCGTSSDGDVAIVCRG
jgi:hypothetical protein